MGGDEFASCLLKDCAACDRESDVANVAGELWDVVRDDEAREAWVCAAKNLECLVSDDPLP